MPRGHARKFGVVVSLGWPHSAPQIGCDHNQTTDKTNARPARKCRFHNCIRTGSDGLGYYIRREYYKDLFTRRGSRPALGFLPDSPRSRLFTMLQLQPLASVPTVINAIVASCPLQVCRLLSNIFVHSRGGSTSAARSVLRWECANKFVSSAPGARLLVESGELRRLPAAGLHCNAWVASRMCAV